MRIQWHHLSLLGVLALSQNPVHAGVMLAHGKCTIYNVNIAHHEGYISHSPNLNIYKNHGIQVVFNSETPSGYESLALVKLNLMKVLDPGSYLKDFRKGIPLNSPVDVRCYSYLLRQCDLQFASPLYSYIHPESMACVEVKDTKDPVLIPGYGKIKLPDFKDALNTFREAWGWLQKNLSRVPWYVYAQIIAILVGVGLWKAGLLVTTGVGALEPLSVILAIVAIISLLAPHMDEGSRSKYKDYIQAGTELIHQETSDSGWSLTVKHPVTYAPLMKFTVNQDGTFKVDRMGAEEGTSTISSGNVSDLVE